MNRVGWKEGREGMRVGEGEREEGGKEERKEGKQERREGWREGGREGGRKEGRKEGRKDGRKGGRTEGREGGREGAQEAKWAPQAIEDGRVHSGDEVFHFVPERAIDPEHKPFFRSALQDRPTEMYMYTRNQGPKRIH